MYISSFGAFIIGVIVGAYNSAGVLAIMHQIIVALNLH
jgi:hypothetical protein